MDTAMFMKYLISYSSFPRVANSQNIEIFVLLYAIQQAFDGNINSIVTIHHHFLFSS
jgi:hypothetical protein